MDELRLNRFYSLLKKLDSSFEVKFKNESTFMKILSYLLFFNKSFMTSFTTTIGSTVYFPDENKFINNTNYSTIILSHEFVHAHDAKKVSKPLFSIAYLFPQILAPFMLFFAFISWWLAIPLFLLFLSPIPAPFRMYFELRGYTMSMFMHNLLLEEKGVDESGRLETLNSLAERYNKQFISFDYYLMWPFGVTNKLKDFAKQIVSGELISNDEIFSKISEAFKDSK